MEKRKILAWPRGLRKRNLVGVFYFNNGIHNQKIE
jgi:hypothetical protein